jgi:hypothetical protein
MPFRKYLEDHTFTPDAVKAMSEALTYICRELEGAGIPQYSTSALVQMITTHASAGETNPERLSQAVIQSILKSKTAGLVRPLEPT